MVPSFKVLYVDDEEGMLDIGKVFLERSGMLSVDTARSGEEALSAVAVTAYDAIISDYQMPSMDGIELLGRLKERGCKVPLVLYTGKGRESVIIDALNAGVASYMQKGGDPRANFAELEHKVVKAASRYRSEMRLAGLSALRERLHEEGGLESRLALIAEGAVDIFKADLARIWMLRPGDRCVDGCPHRDAPDRLPCTYGSDCFHLMASAGRCTSAVDLDRVPRGRCPMRWSSAEVRIDAPGGERTPVLGHVHGAASSLTHTGFRILDRDGGLLGVMTVFRVAPILEDERLLLGALAYTTSQIILRSMAEQALMDSEERLRTIFESANDPIVIADLEGRILKANEMASRVSGYAREELLSMRLEGLFPPGMAGPIGDFLRRTREKGEMRAEGTHLTRRGQEVHIEINARLIQLDGRPAVLCIGRDITERKRMEGELEASRLQLISGMELAKMACWHYDVVTDRFHFDDRFYQLYATDAAREGTEHMSIEEYFTRFVPPEDVELAAQEVARSRARESTEDTYQFEHRILRRDGEVRHINARVCVVRGPGGRPVRTYGVNQDVTEVKRTEEQLKLANQKLRLLSGITRHDIRNQLTVLRGAIALAQGQPDGPVAADLLERMERCAVSIGSHIDFARDYQDLGAASPRWHHLGALVASLPISREVDRLDIAGLEDLWVYADPLLRKVFHNILEDTLKYGARPATVRMSYREEDDGLRLIYEDRGPGVPWEDKGRIFEKGVGKGDGLGLFLSREILAMTGIAIAEAGEPGTGVRFELSVPAGHYRRGGPPAALPGGAPSEAAYR